MTMITAHQGDERDPLTVPSGIPALELESPDQAPEASPEQAPTRNEVLIVTGQSGAGRSTAANALEDLDWYVVDNIPPALLPHLAGMMTPVGGGVHRLAAVVDVRGRAFFADLERVLDDLHASGVPTRIIFLDADDIELVRRFESNRRPHPLQADGTVLDGLRAERRLLEPLRERADQILDTTNMSVHDLSRHMRDIVAGESQRQVQITVESFGFKYGLPLDADHVVDVRFLENPYWVGELRHLTGRDAPVAEYVLHQKDALKFAGDYANLIETALEGYRRELKPFVTVAVGCTGGRHRSVAMAEKIASLLRDRGNHVQVLHRDMGRI